MDHAPKIPPGKVEPSSKRVDGVVSNIAKLDKVNPIPSDLFTKGFVNSSGKRYLPFLDPLDTFFNILTEASLLSMTTRSCINSKVKYVIGSGWLIEDVEMKNVPKDFLDFAKCTNDKGEGLNQNIRDVSQNIFTVGNSFVELARGAVGGKKYLRIFVEEYMDYRLELAEDTGKPTGMVLKSKEFRNSGNWDLSSGKGPIKLPLYNGSLSKQPWKKDEDSDIERLVIHIRNKMPGVEHYGLPSNVGSLPQQYLEYKSSRYNVDNFDNNLVVGGIVTTTSTMTQLEAAKHAKNIVKAHTGDGNTGRWIFLAGPDLKDVQIKPFDTAKDGDFIKLDERIEKKLFLANEWSKVLIDPEMSGLGTSGKLIRDVFELKNNTVIKPFQEFILEQFIRPVLTLADEQLGTKFMELPIILKSICPVGYSGDIDINSVMTVAEGRKALNIPAEATDDNRKISEVKPASNKTKTDKEADPNV